MTLAFSCVKSCLKEGRNRKSCQKMKAKNLHSMCPCDQPYSISLGNNRTIEITAQKCSKRDLLFETVFDLATYYYFAIDELFRASANEAIK